MREFDKKMIDLVVNRITKVYELPQDFAITLSDNIIKRSALYEGCEIPLTNEIKIIKNIDSVPLFLLNRLLNNIRSYEFVKETSNTKGTYTSAYQKMELMQEEKLQPLIKGRLKQRIRNVDSDEVKKAAEKVANHEIGHALQTSFSGTIGINDIKFKELVDSLGNDNPKFFNKYSELQQVPLKREKAGMKVNKSTNPKEKFSQARDYYAPCAYLTYIDEIFNEDEALQITGMTVPQLNYEYGDGYSRPIYNYDSSNYRITPYAKMMKILIGKSIVFKSMYEDPIYMYDAIDQYRDVGLEVFQPKENSEHITMLVMFALNTIKDGTDPEKVSAYACSLDLFFTKCLQKKVETTLKRNNLEPELIDLMIAQVSEFKNTLLVSNKITLGTHRMCEEMLEKLINKKNGMNIDPYSAFIAIGDKICESIDLEDQALYQKYMAMLDMVENKMQGVPLSSLSKDYSTMTHKEKVHFMLYNMKEAMKNKDSDGYRYYRANYDSLVSGISVDNEITPKF